MGQAWVMKLRYTLPARLEFESVLDYLARRSPQGAANVQARIKAVTELLLTHPYIGVAISEPGIRRATVSPYPYVIVRRRSFRGGMLRPLRYIP